MAETTQSAFKHNTQTALQGGTFEEVLKALCIKLCELGVPDAEAPDEADKVNHPLKMAYIEARTLETRDLAWNNLSARILALGSLLPPEAADGAFLADRGQVEVLLEKWKDFWVERAWTKINEERVAGSGRANEQDEDEDGDVSARPFESDIFEGLGKNPDFFRGLYSGGVPPPEQPVSGPSPRGGAPQPDASESSGRPAANGEVDKRAVERQFFEDALLGSPFHGEVDVHRDINTEATTKLLWAVRENPVNDVLWALTLKAAKVGVVNPPTEEETASLIVAMTWSFSYLMEHDDKSIRRDAVDTLRSQLVRLIGLLPQDLWSTDFLDHREDVLRLIGDRASAGE